MRRFPSHPLQKETMVVALDALENSSYIGLANAFYLCAILVENKIPSVLLIEDDPHGCVARGPELALSLIE